MKTSTIKSLSLYVSGIIFIIVIWIILSLVLNNDLVLPSVSSVGKSLIKILSKRGTYLIIFNTIYRLIFALVIAFLVSLILAMLSYVFKWFSTFLAPIIALIRTIPVATIIIILLMILGNKNSPYVICSLVVLPIMYEANINGLNSIDKNILEEVKMISKTNMLVIKDIYIPLVYPYLLSGVITSFGLGLKVMVMAEFICQTPNTIGYVLNQEKTFLEIDNVFAWTIVLIIFILIIELVLESLRKRILSFK